LVLGLRQLKLAAGFLAGAAKAGDLTGIAGAIDLALKATDFGETLRKQDPVSAALRDVSAKLEEATRKALSAEFGADWESRPDLAATLAALPDVLERYAPDTDAIFAANLDPERIARRATDAAEAAHDDLFRKNTIGKVLLFAVVRETYAVSLANKDLASQMVLPALGVGLDRLDKIEDGQRKAESRADERQAEMSAGLRRLPHTLCKKFAISSVLTSQIWNGSLMSIFLALCVASWRKHASRAPIRLTFPVPCVSPWSRPVRISRISHSPTLPAC